MDHGTADGSWAALDGLAAHSGGWNDLISAVEATARQAKDDLTADAETVRPGRISTLLEALHYMAKHSDGRVTFAPYLELADGSTVPAALKDQPEEVVVQWQEGFEHLSHPSWRSRLGHLVLLSEKVVIGRDRPGLAEAVCAAYLAIPASWESGLDHVTALTTAAGLARAFKLNDKRREALEALAEVARTGLASAEPLPGVVLGCTAFLIEQPDMDQAAVAALLEAARTVWAGDIHRLDDVIAQHIKVSKGDPGRRQALVRERVDSWLQAAASESGIRRAVFLQRAVEHAAASEDAALRAQATSRLQDITSADLGMQGISSAMLLRDEQVAVAVRFVTDAADWREALDRFAVMGPATGEAAANRSDAEKQLRTSISALFTQSMYGGDGLPRWTATTEEERLEYTIARNALFELQFRGNLVAEALLRLPQHHCLPSVPELAEHFARSPVVLPDLAEGLARAFLRWWSGDYEGALFTAIPRVERLARNLLLAIDQAIYPLSYRPGHLPRAATEDARPVHGLGGAPARPSYTGTAGR